MIREPLLTTVAIADLRPTQITVGMREVTAKRKRWRETGTRKGSKFLGKHMIPVILGPKRRHYVIDHHHLALALHEEGVRELAVTVVANLSRLESDEFWTVHGQSRVDASVRRPRAAASITKTFPNRSPQWSTIHTGRSPANCAAPAALPKTRRHFRSFSGRISCAAESSKRRSSRISSALWKWR